MSVRNYLIEGVSGTGKTTVAEELQRRGYHVIHGDRELSYEGDPETGERLDELSHETATDSVTWGHDHHIWDVDKVTSLVAHQRNVISFFCGGSRNFSRFIDLFDRVFVLDVDLDTLNRRLAGRPVDEFGGRPAERELIARLLMFRSAVSRSTPLRRSRSLSTRFSRNAERSTKGPTRLGGARQSASPIRPGLSFSPAWKRSGVSPKWAPTVQRKGSSTAALGSSRKNRHDCRPHHGLGVLGQPPFSQIKETARPSAIKILPTSRPPTFKTPQLRP
ncbi:AAA domain-containing protein [Rhizobium mongolense subsp. loessense]|uniref:AAA domain-containing protein n=1 Tax=Rhizobium mongolense subsp. loessense TaxID=158890 RepID=A0A1G4T5J7_9HYPH|nr:AAA domain-containing protein [Rhizobium mongolense subsp. loessense]